MDLNNVEFSWLNGSPKHWIKCKVKNKSVYTFAPTAGPTGNRKALVKKLKTDEFAHMNFKQ